MEKFNLLKVSISSCNSAVPPINVISCTGTTNLTKDWISGWRFRRQNFEFSNPARFEAFWPVACRMWIQGSSRSFPTPWPLWVSCQNVQNATFWEFQCSTPTTKTTKARLFACGRSYPTSRCQNPQAWMWWLDMWIRAPVQDGSGSRLSLLFFHHVRVSHWMILMSYLHPRRLCGASATLRRCDLSLLTLSSEHLANASTNW